MKLNEEKIKQAVHSIGVHDVAKQRIITMLVMEELQHATKTH